MDTLSGAEREAGKPDTTGRRARKPKAVPRPRGLGTTEVRMVPLAEIDRSVRRYQYRLNGSVSGLKASLAREGQREPVDLTAASPHVVIDGYRRVQAVGELGWDSVHALVHEVGENEAHRMAFLKNVVRRNLSPIEKAHAIHLARQRGQSDLAAEFGLSAKQVARYEKLLDFPEAVQKLVDAGELTMAHAKALADCGVKDARPWLAMIAQDGISAAELRKRVRAALGKKAPGRKPVYLRQERNGIRVYAFSIRRDAPKAERERVVTLLREAIEVLTGKGG